MRFQKFAFVCIVCMIIFSFAVSASDKLSFDVRDVQSAIDPMDYFLSAINSSEYPDVELIANGSVWRFSNFSISRTAFAWREFSVNVAVRTVDACPEKSIADILKDSSALYIDFEDGQQYPGLAEVTVALGASHASKSFRVLSFETVSSDSTPSYHLVWLSDRFSSDSNGNITLCTEASRDYILIPSEFSENSEEVLKLLQHPNYIDESAESQEENAVLNFIKSRSFLYIGGAVIAIIILLIVYVVLYKKRAHRIHKS